MNAQDRLLESIARMHEPWGGAHCLDFANTLEPRGGPPPLALPPGYELRDELRSYEDLVGWAVHKGVLYDGMAVKLIDSADAEPDAAQEVLARAQRLRDVIYRAFWQIAQRRHPTSEDLAAIMREFADAAAHATLVEVGAGAGVEWSWPDDPSVLARPLWPVARSAVELLTAGDWKRIKVCPGPGRPPLKCSWLFYDTTKNGSRRWCSMADCGAVTKARRQTVRRRVQRSTVET